MIATLIEKDHTSWACLNELETYQDQIKFEHCISFLLEVSPNKGFRILFWNNFFPQVIYLKNINWYGSNCMGLSVCYVLLQIGFDRLPHWFAVFIKIMKVDIVRSFNHFKVKVQQSGNYLKKGLFDTFIPILTRF